MQSFYLSEGQVYFLLYSDSGVLKRSVLLLLEESDLDFLSFPKWLGMDCSLRDL